MVQEEVALRLTARTGSADYGVLTINASLRADVDLVHKVPRTCFKPAPKVDSAIVRMRTLEAPRFPEAPDSLITRIARAAFGQRRKTLRNTLAKSGAMGLPPDAALEAMEEAGVNPQERPQNVSLEEFAALARAVQARRPPKGAGDAGLPPADHQ
jgi:16S rRNA (adenine1518-N6/adenine1519-N6)-dimethyltransferase